MAYPYDIGATNYSIPYNQGNGGPFYRASNGALYCVLTKYVNPTKTISVFKSSDAGVTWAESDSGNRPTETAGPGNGTSVPVVDDGMRIWVAYMPSGSATAFKAFNTSTDLWEAAVTGGPTPVDANGPSSVNPNRQIGLAVRSADKVMIFSQQTTISSVNYNSLKFQRYVSGSWGSTIDLLVAGDLETGSGTDYNFDLLGCTVGDSDRCVVWAHTTRGTVCRMIDSSGAVSNYRREDMDSLASPTLGHRNGVWGPPVIVQYGAKKFHALPMMWESDVNGESSQFTPGFLMLEDSATPGGMRIERFESYLKLAANWNTCCMAYDSVNKAAYAIWTAGATVANYQTTITRSCSKGIETTAPATLFQTGSNQLVEEMCWTVYNGVARGLLGNSNGNSPYTSVHYYQANIACSASGGCSGNINSAR